MGKQYSFEVHKVCRGLLQECGLRSPGSFPGPARISRHQIQRGRSRDGGCAGHAADSVSRSVALAAANPPGSVPKPPPPPPQGGRGNLSQKICHWLRGRGEGEGGKRVPTNSIKKRRKKGDEKEKCMMGKTDVKPHSSTLLYD